MIKKFNEYNSLEYYVKISRVDARKLMSKTKDIDSSLVDKLGSIDPNYIKVSIGAPRFSADAAEQFLMFSRMFGAENTVDYSHNYIIINRERRNSELYEEVFVSIRVYELLDEWFLLYNANDGEYYKCDQWDGLVRYLSDEVGIILN